MDEGIQNLAAFLSILLGVSMSARVFASVVRGG